MPASMPNRTIAFGPDGMLYLSVGLDLQRRATRDNPENATILRMTPDGKSRTIFASGLRNTIGFDWSPKTGELWGMDHGIDFLGDDVQPEELNRIQSTASNTAGRTSTASRRRSIRKAHHPARSPKSNGARAKRADAVLGYTAHCGTDADGLLPRHRRSRPSFDGDAFVTMRGSWNREPCRRVTRSCGCVSAPNGQARSASSRSSAAS